MSDLVPVLQIKYACEYQKSLGHCQYEIVPSQFKAFDIFGHGINTLNNKFTPGGACVK